MSFSRGTCVGYVCYLPTTLSVPFFFCPLARAVPMTGHTISGAYAVTQGSHMDIDVRVYNPKSVMVYEALREGEGKFTIPTNEDGSYKLCFSNKMSMVSHKTVKLVVDNGEAPDLTGLAKKEHMDSVEQTLITIAHSARMIAFHQEEYRQLHDRHLVSTFGAEVGCLGCDGEIGHCARREQSCWWGWLCPLGHATMGAGPGAAAPPLFDCVVPALRVVRL